MRILQEVTDWGDSNIPNHIYHVHSNGKLVAYQPHGKAKVVTFHKPLSFSTSRRKFKLLRKEPDPIKAPNTIVIEGSNGNEYAVTIENGVATSCTCPGYTFRKTCKHLAMAEARAKLAG